MNDGNTHPENDVNAEDLTDINVSERRGFPNAALNGRVDYGVNLNDLVLQNPVSTFFMRIESDQYADLNLSRGDYVAIDRSLQPHSDDLVVINVDGEFKIARLDQIDQSIELWGVISWIIHRSTRRRKLDTNP